MDRTRIADLGPGTCAWCRVALAGLTPGSHGICSPCAVVVRAALRARPARQLSGARA